MKDSLGIITHTIIDKDHGIYEMTGFGGGITHEYWGIEKAGVIEKEVI